MRKFLLLLLALNLFSNNIEKICDIYFERKTKDYFVESVDREAQNATLPNEGIRLLNEKMGVLLNNSADKKYLNHLVYKNNKLDDTSVAKIFETLSEKQIIYLLEYSVYGKKLNFWKKLISSSSKHHHKNIIGIINEAAKDPDAWNGLKKFFGTGRYSKSTMEKSFNFLLALRYERRNSEKLVVNFLRRMSDGRLTTNTVKKKITEELKENIYWKFKGRKIALKFRKIIDRIFKRSSQKETILDLDYSPEALMNILTLSKSNLNLVYKDLKSLEKTINKSFVNMIFQEIDKSDSARVLKQIKDIKKLQEDNFLDPRVFPIMKEINWNHAPSQVFFKMRNDSKDDGVIKSILILDNLLKFSYLRTVNNTNVIKKYFENMLDEFEANQHVIGISQLYAELGAGTSKVTRGTLEDEGARAFSNDMVTEIKSHLNRGESIYQNHKFRGAHFTYEYFLKIKKQHRGFFKKFKLIGFEVDQFIVKDSNNKRHIIMEYLNGTEIQYAFLNNKKIKYIEKKSVKINKQTKTITIGRKVYKYGAKGSQIGQYRKADFVYKVGSKIYVKEMKNYLSLMNVFNNDGELFFDLLMAQKLGLNSYLNLQWVVNSAAHIPQKAISRKMQIGTLIGEILAKNRYGKFLESLGGKQSSPAKVMDYFSDFFNEVSREAHNKFGIAFFKPEIDTDTIFKKD